jgi:hypothetical protein
MQTHYQTLEAMLHCPYKAWLLSKQELPVQTELPDTALNPITVSALQISPPQEAVVQRPITKISKNHKQAIQLLADIEDLLNKTHHHLFIRQRCPDGDH